MITRCALGLAVLLTASCSSSGSKTANQSKGDAAKTNPGGEATSPGADAGANFEELMGYSWTIDPGSEHYFCVFKTLTEDVWVNQFRPLNPKGTHHVSIGYGEPGRADGVYLEGDDIGGGAKCTGTTLGDQLAFGGLVGTKGFSMPEGVAVKIPAGKQMLLSVHVLNTAETPLTGRSGVEVVHADPSKIKNTAEIIFVNDVGIQVTPGKSTQIGTCTLDADSTFFAMLHHMHKTGVHMKTTALPANGSANTLLDADYDFTEQQFVQMDPLVLAKGDKLQVTCDYENPGTSTLTFGESTELNEMCIALMYRYPASAVNFNCVAVP